MEPTQNELSEQEVTVEVVPQTVTEIIYLQDSDLAYYTPEEDSDEVKTETYEIGTVDMAQIGSKSLVLDATQSFVLLSPTPDFINADTVFFNDVEESEEQDLDDDEQSNVGIGEFICTSCNYKCRSLSSLASHKLIHNEQFIKCNYNCIVCGKQFDKAQTLSHHFRTTHEKPKYVCYICNCSCLNDLALLQHLRIHDPKRFACDVCNAVYDNSIKLINHKKTHNTTLLYACNKCDASFSSTSEVSNHLRLVHAKKSFLSERMERLDAGNYFTLGDLSSDENVEEQCGATVMPEVEESDDLSNLSKKRKTR